MVEIDDPEIERVFREEYGRAVAVLIRAFGDIDIAEEAVQDAFTVAAQRWPDTGLPPSPAGWIITTAKNRAIDRLRLEASLQNRHAQAALLHAGREPVDEGPVRDERLRSMFTSCHPALAQSVQVALTLRLLGGLTTPEIAHASSSPRRPWRSGWCGPRTRSATPASPTACPMRPTSPAVCVGARRPLSHLQRGVHPELQR